MRFRLSTLMIALALGPPVLAWWGWPLAKSQYDAWRMRKAIERATYVVPAGGGMRLAPSGTFPVPGGGMREV